MRKWNNDYKGQTPSSGFVSRHVGFTHIISNETYGPAGKAI